MKKIFIFSFMLLLLKLAQPLMAQTVVETGSSSTALCTINGVPSQPCYLVGSTPMALTPSVPTGLLKGVNGVPAIAAAVDITTALGYTPLPHVSNLLALKLYSYYSQPVVRDGYNGPGDGGYAVYTYNAAACTLNNGLGDGGAQIEAANGNCWYLASGQANVIPNIWGADSTGQSDSTTSLKAFFAFISNNSIVGSCPDGNYKFNNTITITRGGFSFMGPCYLTYDGSSTTEDLILVQGTATAPLMKIYWAGPTIASSTVMTGGDGLHLQYVNYSTFVSYTGDYLNQNRNLFDGVWFDTSSYNRYSGSVYASHYGLNASNGVELDLDHFVADGNGDTAVHLGGGFGGIYFRYAAISCIFHSDGNINNFTSNNVFEPVGLRVDATIAPFINNYQIFVANTSTFDACSAADIYINDTGTQSGSGGSPTVVGLRTFSMDGWASGSHGTGIPNVDIVNWANGTFQVGGGANLINGSGSGILLQDPTVRLTIDPAAWIGQNPSYGVQCTVATRNIQTDASWLTNGLGDYSPLCQGSLTRGAWLSYVPVVSCGSSGGTLGSTAPAVTGLYRVTGFTTDVQVEYKAQSTGNYTNISINLPKDSTGQTKTPVAPFNLFGRDNSNNNIVSAALGAGNPNMSITPIVSNTNIAQNGADVVVNGTYMNNTGQ